MQALNMTHMKTKLRHTLYGVLLLTGLLGNMQAAQAQGSVSLDVFYSELAPYGTWISDAQYGYIWLPNVDASFQPYATNGYWVMTDYGNTWVSDYPWGWAPFHYGRWFYDNFYGWVWIPGTEWAPAWVAWRSGVDYYGWAPLGPGVAIGVSVGNYIPDPYWVFVQQQYIYGPAVYNHYVYYRNDVTIIHRTTIINTTHNYRRRVYFAGPSRQDIERARGGRVEVRSINAAPRPGTTVVRDRSIDVYRPVVRRDRNGNERPTRVTSPEEYRTSHPERREGQVRSTIAPEGTTTNRDRDTRQGNDAQRTRQQLNATDQPVQQRTREQREQREAVDRNSDQLQPGQQREDRGRDVRPAGQNTEQRNTLQREQVEQQREERRREADQTNQQQEQDNVRRREVEQQQREDRRNEAQQQLRERQQQAPQNNQSDLDQQQRLQQLQNQREQAEQQRTQQQEQQRQIQSQQREQAEQQRQQQNQQRQQQEQQQRQQAEQQRQQVEQQRQQIQQQRQQVEQQQRQQQDQQRQQAEQQQRQQQDQQRQQVEQQRQQMQNQQQRTPRQRP